MEKREDALEDFLVKEGTVRAAEVVMEQDLTGDMEANQEEIYSQDF